MPKRKHDGTTIDVEWNKSGVRKKNIQKNSLDSDEDEDEDYEASKYFLKDDDIEGQEESGVSLEEGVQFTPFNMKEEMEEGHFDKDGMYHWSKEKEIKDNWLEDIDWVKIKTRENEQKNENDDDEMPEAIDMIGLYRKILSFMKPKESIAKTLQRLGSKKSLSASERLKLKKAGLLPKPEDNIDDNSVTELTELANRILTHSGNMDIYQETFEHINDLINASSSKNKKEPELDMYSDDFGKKEQEKLESSSTSQNLTAVTTSGESRSTSELLWEYRDGENSEIKGPFSTKQMDKFSKEGRLEKGTLVRKCGTTQFYNSKRIDFDLYL